MLFLYPGRTLCISKDKFNAFHSICCSRIEQVFEMLVSRFSIFWSPIRFSLSSATETVILACTLHSSIIPNADFALHDVIPRHRDNMVWGYPIIHFQDLCHTKEETYRSRNRQRERSIIRDSMFNCLNRLGIVRRRSKP